MLQLCDKCLVATGNIVISPGTPERRQGKGGQCRRQGQLWSNELYLESGRRVFTLYAVCTTV